MSTPIVIEPGPYQPGSHGESDEIGIMRWTWAGPVVIAPSRPLVERVHLVGWGTFEDLQGSILALLFGEMVKRAAPVIQEYHSDLFHDAEWLRRNVVGPTTFDWVVRTSGTNIGDTAKIQINIGAPGAVFYRVEVTSEDRGNWFATFTRIPLDQVKD